MPFQLLTSNPARELKLPKHIKKEMKALSPEAAQTFLRECETSKHGLLFEFALITGMRPEEYLALQWADLDLKKATATSTATPPAASAPLSVRWSYHALRCQTVEFFPAAAH